MRGETIINAGGGVADGCGDGDDMGGGEEGEDSSSDSDRNEGGNGERGGGGDGGSGRPSGGMGGKRYYSMTDLLDPDMEEKEERRAAALKETKERNLRSSSQNGQKGPPAKWGPNANNIRVLPRDQLEEINAQVTI